MERNSDMSQNEFTFEPIASPLEVKFRAFHAENPHVYVELRKLATDWYTQTRGKRPIGMACLFETLRFRIGIETTGDPFKLSNNHRAFYSRLLLIDEPHMAEIIQLKRQTHECTL